MSLIITDSSLKSTFTLFCAVHFVESRPHYCSRTCVVSEFIEFVVNQELCRKQWLEATEQCAELTTRCDEVQHNNEALQTKLKHARLVQSSCQLCEASGCLESVSSWENVEESKE